MTVYYSDHFSGVNPDTFVSDNTVLDKQKRAPVGISHGRMRYQRAQFTRQLALNDYVRMMQFKSSDRLYQLYLTSTATGATGKFHIGVYKTGTLHDGAALEQDIFGAGVVLTSGYARTDRFGTGQPPGYYDQRGNPLWEVVSIGGASPANAYTKDPGEDWDIGVLCNAAFEASATAILEAYYTAGD